VYEIQLRWLGELGTTFVIAQATSWAMPSYGGDLATYGWA
jgi:hypothetical protein